MTAPRASSFKALRTLQKSSSSIPAKRNLSITPRPLEPAHKHSYAPLGLQETRIEVPESEAAERLSGHAGLQARAYSIAMKGLARDQAKRSTRPTKTTPTREFNTSRTLKTVNDSSTIDFAYLPDMFGSTLDPAGTSLRVPILPDIDSDRAQAILDHHDLDVAAGGLQESEHATVMKPEIVTVAETLADGAHVDFDHNGHPSAMSEVQDNHGTEMTVDALTNLAGTVTKSARGLVDKVSEPSTVQRVWNEFLDDLLGARKA